MFYIGYCLGCAKGVIISQEEDDKLVDGGTVVKTIEVIIYPDDDYYCCYDCNGSRSSWSQQKRTNSCVTLDGKKWVWDCINCEENGWEHIYNLDDIEWIETKRRKKVGCVCGGTNH